MQFKSRLISFFLMLALAIFLCSSTVQPSSLIQNDVESPLIPRSDHRYGEVKTDDNDNDNSNTAPVEEAHDQPWKVPLAQFYIGFPINGVIFGFVTSFGKEDDAIRLFNQAICVMSFFVCAQLYFGFCFSCSKRTGLCCSFMPRINYHRITYPSTDMDVSFGRWVAGPFTWIFEALAYLPDEAYDHLRQQANFPKQSVMELIFMVQFLYYLGIWDLYRKNMLNGN